MQWSDKFTYKKEHYKFPIKWWAVAMAVAMALAVAVAVTGV